MNRHRFVLPLVALVAACAAGSAHAADKCKVKIDKKTDVLLVSANDLRGPLLWGAQEG